MFCLLIHHRTQGEAKRIKVTYAMDNNVPSKVLGDEFRLEHVLGNLLSNAIKFSDPDAKIEICVSFDTKVKNHITFSVKDKGPGMSAEDQKHLFQPFMQIRPGELQKGRGSGLGLSICKTIVTLHNGTIGCTSKQRVGDDKDSGGSEFFFNIEFAEVSGENDDDEMEEHHQSQATVNNASMKREDSEVTMGPSLQTLASNRGSTDHTDEVVRDLSSNNVSRRIIEDENYIAIVKEKSTDRIKTSTSTSGEGTATSPPAGFDLKIDTFQQVEKNVEKQVEQVLSNQPYRVNRIMVCDGKLSINFSLFL